MFNKISNQKKLQYDTTINVIGGLKDLTIIDHTINYFFDNDQQDDAIIPKDQFDLRTERTQTRVERGIRRGFLKFTGPEHKALIQELFRTNLPLQDRNMVLFWQFAINNSLFREISTQAFVKVYWSGRAVLPKEEIIAYIKDLIHRYKKHNLDWSESTIITLARKYLNFLTKLGFIHGAQKKSFNSLSITSESIILFLYFAQFMDPTQKNMLKNHFFDLSLIPSADLVSRLKKLSIKGYFDMEYNGSELKINLIHSPQRICHVLYNRP